MCVPDNYDLFVAHEAEQERRMRRLPVCCYCEERIQQAKAVCINGDWYCNECIEELTEDIEDF